MRLLARYLLLATFNLATLSLRLLGYHGPPLGMDSLVTPVDAVDAGLQPRLRKAV
jgi:hypothetical protein